jgi:Icc-related predicted phosphoesterase
VSVVRVLALADKPPPLDPALMAEQMGADAVVCLGDLDRAWIEPLAHLHLPRVGVHGNHDEPGLLREVEVQDLDGRRTSLGGMTFAGFEGCVRYGHGGPYHYTQREASKRARRLPAAEVLLTHCPPRGINDDPDDPAHVGFEGLLEWVQRHRPRHLLHGHTHPIGGRVMRRFEDTRVHWISGARMVLLD